ncbi:methyl-accepting chemotaxis protein [Gimibacter soli]|uniref:Nitrate- and nitrite sensing domain-containing protein n=1 Tax=Gimibacter soli TaxID=3024400 RepID=A0AAE9XWT2_9PROT|nr:nitrate- and nitrite sensing domain-containing protein [Gimibacter soli]WCL54849.1 nitrate- and nitrite sensing domain-containing protein [Gimibacter soli]
MRFLDDLSIRSRLLLIVGLATVTILLFSVPRIFEAVETRSRATVTISGVELAESASALVHELQKERGTSAGYIGSRGNGRLADNLTSQRRETDTRLERLINSFGLNPVAQHYSLLVMEIRSELDKIDTVRADVSALNLSVPEMAGYYTGTIGKLLRLYADTIKDSADSEITVRGAALLALLEAKERAGLERAMGASGFGAGSFSPEIARNFTSMIAQQEAFLSFFRAMADKQKVRQLDAVLASPEAGKVNTLRATALASFTSGDTGGVTGADWFEAATDRIDRLYELEKSLSGELSALAAERSAAAATALLWTAAFNIGTMLVMIGLSLILSESIRRPIYSLMGITNKISAGEFDTVIPFQRQKSEIGSFSRNLDTFRNNLKDIEEMRQQKREEDIRIAQEEQRREEGEKRAELEAKMAAQKAASERQAAVAESLSKLANLVENELSTMVASIVEASNTAARTGTRLSDATTRMTDVMDTVKSASGTALGDAQAIAAASEELDASIREISVQVQRSQELVSTMTMEAEDVSRSLGGLTSAAEHITDVVTIIGDIADQTNLLALNATIEAARAGDAGKGFAVVASEVKGLANQTAKSSEEIQGLVQSMLGEVEKAVSEVKKIVGRMSHIAEASSGVASAITQQSATTQEISRATQSSSKSVENVSTKIGDMVDEVAALDSIGAEIEAIIREIEGGMTTLKSNLEHVIEDNRAMSDRRGATRHPLARPYPEAQITDPDGKSHTISILDASATGIRAEGIAPLAAKANDAVDLYYDGKFAAARVAWVENGQLGLAYLDTAEAAMLTRSLQYAIDEGAVSAA